MPQVRILSLGPPFLEKPPVWAVFLRFEFSFFGLEIAVLRRFQGRRCGGHTNEDSRRNHQIPNPSLTGKLPHFAVSIGPVVGYS